MTCQRCGQDINTDSAYCRFCGTRAASPSAPRRLVRLPGHGSIAGVCAGIAAYLNTDVTLVRLAWVVLSIVPGALIGGVIAYAIAWVLMPEALVSAPPPLTGHRLMRSTSERRIAGVCGGLADYFTLDPTLVRLVVVILSIYPGALICGVIGYVIAWLIIPSAPAVPLTPVSAPL